VLGLLAVACAGLTPLAAILAGPGTAKAAANGWQPPYPATGSHDAQRLSAAEECADGLAGAAFKCLDDGERAELVSLLQWAHRQLASWPA
jgi:hypothetical protein